MRGRHVNPMDTLLRKSARAGEFQLILNVTLGAGSNRQSEEMLIIEHADAFREGGDVLSGRLPRRVQQGVPGSRFAGLVNRPLLVGFPARFLPQIFSTVLGASMPQQW
ncbi:uncharacterized protein [Dermacentor albipictus]|uniref:uncharacterized protein n=1 Tax=Dermacentor albipictus TaxID=60249 RepID=UPI0038FC81F0